MGAGLLGKAALTNHREVDGFNASGTWAGVYLTSSSRRRGRRVFGKERRGRLGSGDGMEAVHFALTRIISFIIM